MAPSQRGRKALVAALEREGKRSGASSTLLNHACAEVLGIHATDWEAVDFLDWAGPVTAGQLAALTGLTSGAVTGLIDRLERERLVRRVRDPADRRRVIIELIDDRADEIRPIFEPIRQALDEIHARYSADELAVILDYFERVNGAISDVAVQIRARHRTAGP